MDAVLASLDPKMRLSVSMSFCLLAAICGWFALGLMMSGPWWLAFVVALLAAVSVNMWHAAWPSALPPMAQDPIERWRKIRSRSTKTPAGKFMWKAGRSVIAACLSYEVMTSASGIEGYVLATMIAGFSVSVGFFGTIPGIWSGLVLFVMGHRIALAGLNVDFGDPQSRDAMQTFWYAGQSISWWWPIGFVSFVPLWVGMSALSVKVGAQMREDLAERKAIAIAKKKIDDRRKRLRARNKVDEVDAAELARKQRQEAEARVAEVASGGIMGEVAVADTPSGESKESDAVTRIERENNEQMLKDYTRIVEDLLHNDEMGIDTNSQHRRSFDRVVQSLSDEQLRMLDAGMIPNGKVLRAYYNRLCGLESEALAGGDGEVVSFRSSQSSNDVDSVSGFATRFEPDVDGHDFDDILDNPGAARVSTMGSRQASAASTLDMMLADTGSVLREGVDGAPVGGENLPLAGENVSGEEAMPVDKEELVVEHVSSDLKAFTADSQNDEGQQPVVVPVAGVLEAVDVLDAGAGMSAEVTGNPESVNEVDHRQAVGDDLPVEEDPAVGSVTVDGAPAALGAGTVEERRMAAGIILMGKGLDREFVMRTLDYFPDLESVSAAIGLPVSLVSEGYEAYQPMVAGARQEAVLAGAIEADDLPAAQLALSIIEKVKWDADPDLIAKAHIFFKHKEDEAAAAAEREREAEAEREREAAEQRRLEEEEQRRRDEEDRDRLEKEAAEAARLEAEEAERVRLEALEANRQPYAVKILIGNYGDEVLDAGGELFPSIDVFAESLNQPVDDVRAHYEGFIAKRSARIAYLDLHAAVREKNLEVVQQALASPEQFKGYVYEGITLEDAQKWAQGEAVQRRVLLAVDTTDERLTPVVGNAGKAFMKKRLGTPEHVIGLIENELPMQMRLVAQLQRVVGLGSANQIMVQAFDAAVMSSSMAAAEIVKHEKTSQDYARAFFPVDVREEGVDVWDQLVKLAAKAPSEAVVEGQSVDQVGEGSQAGLKAPIALDYNPVEDVQKRNPMDEITGMMRTIKPVNEASVMNWYANIARDFVWENAPEGVDIYERNVDGSVSMFFQKDGVDHGRLLIKTPGNEQFEPVWYHEASDTIYAIRRTGDKHGDVEYTKFAGASWIEKKRAEFGYETFKPREKLKAIVIASTNITEDGLLSFVPLLAKTDVLVEIHKLPLSGDKIRALVERARGV